MLNTVTYDISFSFEQPDYVLRALLSPVQQRLNQIPVSSNPHEMIVRNGLTILIIDAYESRARYLANLLITVGYRPVVTANALAAYTLFLQGACLPLAIVQGREENGSHSFFLRRLMHQLTQKYGWQAPLLRLQASSPSMPVSGPLSRELREPVSPPTVSSAPGESLTPPPPGMLPVRTRLAVRNKSSSPLFSPLSPGSSGPLLDPTDPISEPLGPIEPSTPQLEFVEPLSVPPPVSMASLPRLEAANQIPALPVPEPISPVLVSDVSIETPAEHHAQDAEEMLARISAYRKNRISLEGQTIIIRYQVRKSLGGGSYSDVYLTRDRFREQECALKAIQTDLLPDHLFQSSLEEVTIFQQEIELLNKLKHPHILPVLNSGKSYVNSSPFIYKSMPYCSEGSLTSWMRLRGTIGSYSLSDLMPIILQLADALQYAHASNVLYQNFKQSNILVLRPGKRVQMLDVALADFSTIQNVPLVPMSPESLLYIAPERWQGSVLPASDQYGLAALAYELLTGRPPYQGISERILKLLHTTREPQRASALNRKLSRQVDDVLMRGLAKRPGDRFESVAHFAHALERCL